MSCTVERVEDSCCAGVSQRLALLKSEFRRNGHRRGRGRDFGPPKPHTEGLQGATLGGEAVKDEQQHRHQAQNHDAQKKRAIQPAIRPAHGPAQNCQQDQKPDESGGGHEHSRASTERPEHPGCETARLCSTTVHGSHLIAPGCGLGVAERTGTATS